MHGSQNPGYLKECRHCGHTIYMAPTPNGCFRPCESWKAGACDEGEWIGHYCVGSSRSRDAGWTPYVGPPPRADNPFSRQLALRFGQRP